MHRTALVMIVRNERRCIQRCLLSVKPWVDELVVMDTGSTDDTVALARACGATVHHMAWPDSFAAARNAALDCSTADWRIVLDADEYLQHGGEALAALRQHAPDFVGALDVVSVFHDGTGTPGRASSLISRVLPRGVRYEGVIHEQPVHRWPVRRLPVAVQHDGYLPEYQQGKGDRNQRLLQAALAARPHDPYLLYQAGKDHEVHDRFEPARQAYDAAYALTTASAPYRHDLVLRHLFTLKALGRTAEAIHLADSEMAHWPHSADFHFVLGDVLLDHALAHPASAPELLPMIEASWQQCLALGDTPALEGAVQGRGSYLAAHNLAAFHECLGHVEQAAHFQALARRLREAAQP
ncbi:MAG: glycosyltransferase family 2 protein [Rubrivivax sp.]|nr:MAG: glycosyltransferase family 2 protein [Rubrivivax sp.]